MDLNGYDKQTFEAAGIGGATVHRITKAMPAAWGSLTADVLAAKKFDPVRYVVPGILPEGLTLLAGRPKFGKSFLAMGLGIAVACGGFALGSIECEPGDVLYGALEDSERRLHDRLHKMLPHGRSMPPRLHFATAARRIGEGLEDDLTAWLDDHPQARLVILDTWRCIKPNVSGRGSAYDEDASGLSPLHELSKAHPGVAFIVIHHVRKMDADDVFDTISGTHGLTGVADTLMVLARHGEGAKLCAQGRDLDGYEKALNRDAMTGGWIVTGDAASVAKTDERQQILDVLADGDELGPREIADLTGQPYVNIRQTITRMAKAGEVIKAKRGLYRHPCHNSHNVTSTGGSGGNSDNVTDVTGYGDGGDDD